MHDILLLAGGSWLLAGWLLAVGYWLLAGLPFPVFSFQSPEASSQQPDLRPY